ncbi:hypothetical protein ZWY2020_016026 [Hordeum vulgare]|nr:hypothetical protein ZWY2020_016026 [Hordeum vulgare]
MRDDAGHLFDGMPPMKKRMSASAGEHHATTNRIVALPDNILHHMLSFLPARTCMLARRWRHLWRSTAGDRP